MLKSANYKEDILRQSEFAPKYKVSARRKGKFKTKKAKNAKRKRQKAKYKQKAN